ncbi:HYR domain-containing protein [Pyxidicoccus sp. 3LG]
MSLPASRPAAARGRTQVSVSVRDLPPYGPGYVRLHRHGPGTRRPPAVTCPGPQVAQSSTEVAVSFPPATATDAVTGSPVLHYSQESGSTFARGTTEVTVTATDAAGNTASCAFTVTVQDKGVEPPAPPPEAEASSGCGCGVASPGAVALGLLFLLAPFTRARRRGGATR